jgi:hypothetical protein
MHNNPVKRGLVAQPGDWPWSRRGGEVLLLEGQFCSDYGPDALRCNCERSRCDNRGADIQTDVSATREGHDYSPPSGCGLLPLGDVSRDGGQVTVGLLEFCE